MLLTVTAGGTAHVTLKDLPIVSGGGEACHAGGLCDALPRPKERKAVLDPQEQDILEDGHLHIFFEKTTAFTFADVYMVCNLIQGNLLGIMILNIREDLF